VSTLLFVHGTGVRDESYFRTVDLISRKTEFFLKTCKFRSCQWGDPYGARLNAGGVSIPGYDDSGEATTSLEDASMARWHLLSQDPLLELRILPREAVVGTPSGLAIWNNLKVLPQHPVILTLLKEWCVDAAWTQYMNAVLADEIWKNLVAPITEVPGAVSDRLARALIAGFQIYLRQQSLPGFAAAQRDQLKSALVALIGGSTLGVGDWFLGRLTHAMRVRRGSITDSTSPMVGDILRYQARGKEIRNFIRETINGCNDEVVILAHSLGGVACVDLLAEQSTPAVTHLVTAGSQAPYFYELDALVSRSFGSGLGDSFNQKWLNFYDRRDFLSYAAARIFPGKVIDQPVDNGQPFPESHGAYWHNDKEFWTQTQKFIGAD
jgi:hypothetical protein